jgi:hypothetical protein
VDHYLSWRLLFIMSQTPSVSRPSRPLGSAVLASAALIAALSACANATEAAPPREPEPARARAALATLHVDNRTAHRLTILYRISSRGPAEVAVGHVAPQAAAVLAPVPAGETLVILARTAAGAELALPPRTFELDGEWTWLIPAAAVFSPPPGAKP